jgi:hypothetical protein
MQEVIAEELKFYLSATKVKMKLVVITFGKKLKLKKLQMNYYLFINYTAAVISFLCSKK